MTRTLPPAVLLAGDPYLAEEKYRAILADAKAKIPGEIQTQSFTLLQTPLDTILSLARNLPFLAAFQIFRVQDSQSLKEKKLEPLLDYLENPSETATLIFEAQELHADSALGKGIAKKGAVFFLQDTEKKSAGAKLVREKLRSAGKTLGPGALERLESQAGDAPAFMASVLDQLILYAGDRSEITEDMAESFQENWKEPNIFALSDAILSRKSKEALICLKQILAEDEKEIIPLLGFLHWQLRRLWQAKAMLEDGVNQSDVLKKCKVYPKQAPFFMRQLQALSRTRLEQALEGLFKLDWDMKTGRAQGAVEVEKWLVQVTG